MRKNRFGTQLKKLREAKGLGQNELADMCNGITCQLIRDYETKDIDVSYSVIEKFAEVLDVPPDYFFEECDIETFLQIRGMAVMLSKLKPEKRKIIEDMIDGYILLLNSRKLHKPSRTS